MIQRQIKHRANRFKACLHCGRQPLHIRSLGRSSAESSGLNAPHIQRNHLECAHCGIATPKVASLRTAVIEWNATNTTRQVAA